MPTPTRFHIQVRKPERPGDPGEVAIGYYTYANGIVTLTDEHGEPLPGGHSTELTSSELPSIIAKQLLRQQRSLNQRNRSFRDPIRYKPLGIV